MTTAASDTQLDEIQEYLKTLMQTLEVHDQTLGIYDEERKRIEYLNARRTSRAQAQDTYEQALQEHQFKLDEKLASAARLNGIGAPTQDEHPEPLRGRALTPAQAIAPQDNSGAGERALIGAVAAGALVVPSCVLAAEGITVAAITLMVLLLSFPVLLVRAFKAAGWRDTPAPDTPQLAALEVARHVAPHATSRPELDRVDYTQYAVICDQPGHGDLRLALVTYTPDPAQPGEYEIASHTEHVFTLADQQQEGAPQRLSELRGELEAQAAELEAAAREDWENTQTTVAAREDTSPDDEPGLHEILGAHPAALLPVPAE